MNLITSMKPLAALGFNEVCLVIPSTQRAKTGTTWKLYQSATVLVHESEADDYRDLAPQTHRVRGGLTPIRNFILDAVPPGTWVIMLDDDIRRVGYFSANKRAHPWSAEFHLRDYLRIIAKAEATGYWLCGEAPTKNPLNYRKPLTTSTFIEGHCMMVRVCELRFDERCVIKQDYDYVLQCIAAGKGVMRADYLWSDYDYHSMAGGCASFRDERVERETFEYLLEKWGDWLTPKRGKTKTTWELTINKRAIARDVGRA